MQDEKEFTDPFNWFYVFAALIVLLAFPLLNAVVGWFVYYL